MFSRKKNNKHNSKDARSQERLLPRHKRRSQKRRRPTRATSAVKWWIPEPILIIPASGMYLLHTYLPTYRCLEYVPFGIFQGRNELSGRMWPTGHGRDELNGCRMYLRDCAGGLNQVAECACPKCGSCDLWHIGLQFGLFLPFPTAELLCRTAESVHESGTFCNINCL